VNYCKERRLQNITGAWLSLNIETQTLDLKTQPNIRICFKTIFLNSK
jgi:hypothetical protein